MKKKVVQQKRRVFLRVQKKRGGRQRYILLIQHCHLVEKVSTTTIFQTGIRDLNFYKSKFFYFLTDSVNYITLPPGTVD